MGIEFEWDERIVQSEILNAAALFFQKQPFCELWKEAFHKDPHTPRAALYPGGVRFSLAAQRLDWQVREVEREKSGSDGLTDVYAAIRTSGISFERQVLEEYYAAVRFTLTYLVDPADCERSRQLLLAQARQEMANGRADRDQIFGPAESRQRNFQKMLEFCRSLIGLNPELGDKSTRQAFVASSEVGDCPTLMYPSLIFAGLALTPHRKSHPSDRYDRTHLTKGLSRCDIVTCDSGMAQMLRERGIVPSDVILFSSVEHAQLLNHVKTLLK